MDKKILTWKQKLEKGIPLNELEEVQADADFNYTQREAERKARAEYETMKRRVTPETEDKKGTK